MSYTEKRHSRQSVRHNATKHIKRKAHILNHVYWGDAYQGFTKGHAHWLSKNKIHCSCPMCQEKTKKIGFKHADLVNLAKGFEDDNCMREPTEDEQNAISEYLASVSQDTGINFYDLLDSKEDTI